MSLTWLHCQPTMACGRCPRTACLYLATTAIAPLIHIFGVLYPWNRLSGGRWSFTGRSAAFASSAMMISPRLTPDYGELPIKYHPLLVSPLMAEKRIKFIDEI